MSLIHIDLDGVLTSFVSGALKQLGFPNVQIPENEPSIEKWPGINISTTQFWKEIDKTNEHFWANLEKYPWADELVSLCESYGNVFILTAPSRNPYCSAGKVQWVQKHFPRLSRKMIITSHKYLCAAPDRILVDDTDKKIDSFVSYGGKGILFPQPWNSNFLYKDINKIDFVREKLENFRNV